jgi:hypothetical protein
MRPHSTIRPGFLLQDYDAHGPRRSRRALYASHRLTSSVQFVDLQGILTSEGTLGPGGQDCRDEQNRAASEVGEFS